ncbi:ABC transporter, partial [Streptomyces varsoviensis]
DESPAALLAADLVARVEVLTELGLGYLSTDRPTPTLSAGELQRLRLATQLRSGLFGVVYVLDEPSAGLHPADSAALLTVLDRLKAAGNSLFVVEHHMDVVRRADWIVDVGPHAGEHGGRVLYSGPVAGLADVAASATRRFVFPGSDAPAAAPERRTPSGTVRLHGVTRHNLRDLDADIPLGVFTAVTGVSGSGKSTLISQVLADLVAGHLGGESTDAADPGEEPAADADGPYPAHAKGLEAIDRLVRVDQKPIGRTPRSNLATYTGLFDAVRKVFAATDEARARGYT